jgi:hypothetical protein
MQKPFTFQKMADDDGTAFNAFRIRLISSSTASTIKIQKDTDKVRRTMLLISIIGLRQPTRSARG